MAKQFTPTQKAFDNLDDQKAEIIYNEVNENLNSAIKSLNYIRAKAITLLIFIILSTSFLTTQFIDMEPISELENISKSIKIFISLEIVFSTIIGAYLVITCFLAKATEMTGSTPSRIIHEKYLEQSAIIYKVIISAGKEEAIKKTTEACSRYGQYILRSTVLLLASYLISILIAALLYFF